MADEQPPPGPRLVSHLCPGCAVTRVFEVVQRSGRLRMVCRDCATDLPASLGHGPASHWRDLVDGPPVESA